MDSALLLEGQALRSDGPCWTTPTEVQNSTMQERAIGSIPMLCPQMALEVAILMAAIPSIGRSGPGPPLQPFKYLKECSWPTLAGKVHPTGVLFGVDLHWGAVLEWPWAVHWICPLGQAPLKWPRAAPGLVLMCCLTWSRSTIFQGVKLGGWGILMCRGYLHPISVHRFVGSALKTCKYYSTKEQGSGNKTYTLNTMMTFSLSKT